MEQIEEGVFSSVAGGPTDLTPFWGLDGWVYRGGGCNDWLHSDSCHSKIPWWHIREQIHRFKMIYMGYAKCRDGRCLYCHEQIPPFIQSRILLKVLGAK